MLKAQADAEKAKADQAYKQQELQLKNKEIEQTGAIENRRIDAQLAINDKTLTHEDNLKREDLAQTLAIHSDTHGLNKDKMRLETPDMNVVMGDTMKAIVPHIEKSSQKAAGEALQQLLPAIADHIQKTALQAHKEVMANMPKTKHPVGITRKRDKAGKMTHGVVTYDDGSTQEISVQ